MMIAIQEVRVVVLSRMRLNDLTMRITRTNSLSLGRETAETSEDLHD